MDTKAGIIAGHGRLLAARKLNLAEVPVIVLDHLSEMQKRAFILADNKLALNAGWDEEVLSLELAELQELDFDLELLGFDETELGMLLADQSTEGLTAEDAVPAPPANPVSLAGDLWILGDHRLLCGDSAMAENFTGLLEGATAALVNTDPPYNVRVEPRSNNAIAAGLSSFSLQHHQGLDLARHPGKRKRTSAALRPKDRPLANDFLPEEQFDQLLTAWFTNIAASLKPGGVFYIWGGYSNYRNYPLALERAGLYMSQLIVWDKQHPVLTRKDFMGAHESAFYGWKQGAAHQYFGANNITDLWQVKKVNPQNMVHLTEKPVELAERAILYSSRAGDLVLDPFGGSGSTLIACEKTRRQCRTMEIDRAYCDVILTRWQSFTGRQARLEGDGRTFDEVAAERGKEKKAPPIDQAAPAETVA